MRALNFVCLVNGGGRWVALRWVEARSGLGGSVCVGGLRLSEALRRNVLRERNCRPVVAVVEHKFFATNLALRL